MKSEFKRETKRVELDGASEDGNAFFVVVKQVDRRGRDEIFAGANAGQADFRDAVYAHGIDDFHLPSDDGDQRYDTANPAANASFFANVDEELDNVIWPLVRDINPVVKRILGLDTTGGGDLGNSDGSPGAGTGASTPVTSGPAEPTSEPS